MHAGSINMDLQQSILITGIIMINIIMSALTETVNAKMQINYSRGNGAAALIVYIVPDYFWKCS